MIREETVNFRWILFLYCFLSGFLLKEGKFEFIDNELWFSFMVES